MTKLHPIPGTSAQPQDGTTTPRVVDNRTKPAGLMSSTTKSWLIMGVTVAIAGFLWLSTSSQPASTKTTAQKSLTVEGKSETALTDTDIHIREQQERQKQIVQQHVQQMQPELPGQQPAGRGPASGSLQPDTAQTQAMGALPRDPDRDPIALDERKRAYVSLYASNISLTYRNQKAQAGTADTALASAPIQQFNPYLYSQLPTSLAPIVPPQSSPQSEAQGTQALQKTHAHVDLNPSSKASHVIFEGTVLESTLLTQLNGDFSGPVICMTTTDLYSHDRQKVLVPAGSKILGETKKVDGFGQRRIAVVFHRLLMPDGYSVDLDDFTGLNQIGETALKDDVNNHYRQIFGASIAVGAIAGLAQGGTTSGGIGGQSSSDSYRQGVSSSLSQSSIHILDRFLNILPTITIRAGHRVRVYFTGDIAVPAYQDHQMRSDL